MGKEIGDVVKPSNINESSEIREHCNDLMTENISLKKELFNVRKAALCADISESLTLPQTQAFKSLVEMHFNNISDSEKSDMSLEDIEESILKIKNSIEAVSAVDNSESDSLDESETDSNVHVSKESSTAWKRFV